MTKLGLFLAKKFINKAELSRNSGISASRLSKLSLNENTKMTAEEFYQIVKALELDANEVLEVLYGGKE